MRSRINASFHSYVAGVKDIENFEKGGGFKVTKRISTPPRLEDFALLSLPDDDLQDLRYCQVGDCELKLGEEALRRFRALNWNAPDAKASANAVMQRLAVEYVTNYLAGETPGWRSIAMRRVRRSWLTSSAA